MSPFLCSFFFVLGPCIRVYHLSLLPQSESRKLHKHDHSLTNATQASRATSGSASAPAHSGVSRWSLNHPQAFATMTVGELPIYFPNSFSFKKFQVFLSNLPHLPLCLLQFLIPQHLLWGLGSLQTIHKVPATPTTTAVSQRYQAVCAKAGLCRE